MEQCQNSNCRHSKKTVSFLEFFRLIQFSKKLGILFYRLQKSSRGGYCKTNLPQGDAWIEGEDFDILILINYFYFVLINFLSFRSLWIGQKIAKSTNRRFKVAGRLSLQLPQMTSIHFGQGFRGSTSTLLTVSFSSYSVTSK